MDDQHYILTCIIKNKSIASWNEDHKLIIRGGLQNEKDESFVSQMF